MELATEEPDIPSGAGYAEESKDCRLTIEETLESLGMLKNEVKVFLCLSQFGSLKAKEICELVKIHRTETYRLLHHLERRGLVYVVLGKPVKFSAVSLDKALDLLVEAQRAKIDILQNKKTLLLELWMSIPQPRQETVKKQLFQKVEGEQQIILKANELLNGTKEEFQLFATDDYLAELYYGNFFDRVRKLQDKLKITVLSGSTQKSQYFLEKIRLPGETQGTVEVDDLPCFMISDRCELLVAFNEEQQYNESGHRKKGKAVAFWTNYKAVTYALVNLFLKLCCDAAL